MNPRLKEKILRVSDPIVGGTLATRSGVAIIMFVVATLMQCERVSPELLSSED